MWSFNETRAHLQMRREATERRIIRILLCLLRRRSGYEGKPWLESDFPHSGFTCLVADGLASSSTPSPLRHFVPLLDVLGPTIRDAMPIAIRRGFSYSQPGLHYGPPNTDISLLFETSRLFRPYAPTLQPEQQVIYIGFSMGADLLALGLGERLAQFQQTPPGSSTAPFVPALILLQPALALGISYLKAAQELDVQSIPPIITAFIQYGSLLKDRLVDSLQTIISCGTQVFMIYWPEDQFAVYPTELRTRLEGTGVSLKPFSFTPDPQQDAFTQHCQVASQLALRHELSIVLGRVNQPPPRV